MIDWLDDLFELGSHIKHMPKGTFTNKRLSKTVESVTKNVMSGHLTPFFLKNATDPNKQVIGKAAWDVIKGLGIAGKSTVGSSLAVLGVAASIGIAGPSLVNSTNVGHSLLTTGHLHSAKLLDEKSARDLVGPSFPNLYWEAKKSGHRVIDHIPPVYKINEYEKGITGEYSSTPFTGDYVHVNTDELRFSHPAQSAGHEMRHAFQAKQFETQSGYDKAYESETSKHGYNKNKFEVDASKFESRMTIEDVPPQIEKEAIEVFKRLPYKKPILARGSIEASLSQASNVRRSGFGAKISDTFKTLGRALRR